MKINLKLPFAITVILFSTLACAEQESRDQSKGKHRGPPPEAIAACENVEEQSTCSFKGRRGEDVSGQCQITPEEVLACVPENHRSRKVK